MKTHHIALAAPLAVGAGVFACTILIHALAVGATVFSVRRERRLGHAGAGFWTDVAIAAVAISFAVVAHLAEISLWALVLRLIAPRPPRRGHTNSKRSARPSITPPSTTRRWATAT